MNLLEAAIELLKEARRAMTPEDLVRMAVERKLVARGSAKALEKQLAAEAEAADGRLSKSDGGFAMRKAGKASKGKPGEKKPPAAAKKPAPAKEPVPAKGKKPTPAKVEKKAPPKGRKSRAKAEPEIGEPEISELADEAPIEVVEVALSAPGSTDVLAGFAPAPGAVEPEALDDNELADDDEDALHERIAVEAAEVAETALAAGAAEEQEPMSPEEKALVDLYSEDLGTPAQAHIEYQDQRTADEDRPMLPEINAREERQKRWEQRRDERRRRREEDRQRREEERQRRVERDRQRETRPESRPDARPESKGERPAEGRPQPRPEARPEPRPEARPEPRPEARPEPRPDARPEIAVAPTSNGEHVVHRVGNTLGDAAWLVFSSLRSGQPMPVRQLAQMMRKRGLIESEPEQVWPHLKAALLGDERSYRSLGLRPRIVYRGRDLFAPGPVAQSATATAEAGLATALSQLAVATHKVLKERIAGASQGGFERLVHAYLVAVGYGDIEWIKRVPGISYGTAMPPDGSSAVLVSARAGDSPVDRRGVGELRVGVEAKSLLSGVLIAARELSDEAERELERPGRSIAVVCGDAFVAALLGSGVGVVTTAAPVRYVDDQLLDELLAG